MLEIKDLEVEIDSKKIFDKLNLSIGKGELHILMGPNGSGKSSLFNVVMGSPDFEVKGGKVLFEGEDITDEDVDKRAKKGIFMSFQSPEEVPGVKVSEFLRFALKDENLSSLDFMKKVANASSALKFKNSLASRHLNVGFSGGEKKKCEVLQMKILNPKLAMLDEVDSGLDIDASKDVISSIKGFMETSNGEKSMIIITHNTNIIDELPVDYVHILKDGKIVKSGDKKIIREISEKGFENIYG